MQHNHFYFLQEILDLNPYDVGRLFNVSVINRNGIDVVKISASRGMLEYANGNITKLCTWDSDRLISFGDYNYGYSMKYDGGGTEDPEMYLDVTAVQEIYKTNDGGVTWISDNTGNNPSEYFRTSKKFYSNGEITYYTKSGTGLTAQFIARKLYNNFRYNFDNISSSGSFSINNQTKNTPLDQYFRGGIYPVWTEAILNSGQTNERIFYRWNNGRMLSSYNNFDNYYEGIVGPYYKTKQIADNQWAINNPTQTKSVRDTSIVSGGIIHQVHESIGGIFYTRSTDGGATFEREEIAKLKS